MDDARNQNSSGNVLFPRCEACRADSHRDCRKGAQLRILLATSLFIIFLPGCSLFIMAGKAILGDPQTTSTFELSTRVNLVKEGHQVLVVCSTPDAIKSEFPSINFDVLDGVTRRLKVHRIKVVDPDKISTWLDDHGGRWNDISELGEDFHADYIIHMDLAKFTCKEDNSPTLLRGQTEGRVHVYRVSDGPTGKLLSEVMDHEFTMAYPQGYPVSIEKKSSRLFTQEYTDRVCTKLAQLFYDHPVSEEIE